MADRHNHIHAAEHLAGGIDTLLGPEIRPTMNATENNWAPAGIASALIVRPIFAGPGFAQLSGLVGGIGGRRVVLSMQEASYPCTLLHQSTSSSAANRFIGPAGQDLDLDSGSGTELVYDGTAQRWAVVEPITFAPAGNSSVFLTADIGIRTTANNTVAARSGHVHQFQVLATGSLPAAGSGQNGLVVIEDAGAGDRNLVIYAGGQRFRIDGGAAF